LPIWLDAYAGRSYSIFETIIPGRRATKRHLQRRETGMKRLDLEERELLESYERDEWQSAPNLEFESDRYRGYASATFRKDKRFNISISQKDLAAIQKKALEEGIPYQTLIASILHKYLSGRLSEKKA
jgi:predicted DNA binding CopG/RHH family protein